MEPRVIKPPMRLAGAIVAFRSAKEAWAFGAGCYVYGANGDFGSDVLKGEGFAINRSLAYASGYYWLQSGAVHLRSLCYLFALLFSSNGMELFAQPIPAWRTPPSTKPLDNLATIKLSLKPKVYCEKNIVELGDIAELSGSESILQSVRRLPLGPAPIGGSRQNWHQEDVLRLLQLRGIDPKIVQWGGDDECQVVREAPPTTTKAVDYTPSNLTPQATTVAERTVASLLATYLKTKSIDATSWTIKPTIPIEHTKLLSQRNVIKGIAGGAEPWTGNQKFALLIKSGKDELEIEIDAVVQPPSMVLGANGPLSKGHVISESDLKLVRLTSSMKAGEQDCFQDAQVIIGKELRRNISTGQPFLHGDTGPASIVRAHDLVEIQVVAGAVVAQTPGRAMQSGGLDEVIEVEVAGTKKRLAARIVGGNIVEAIAR